MDSNFSIDGLAVKANFVFAFNNENFSDRLLRIEIMGDEPQKGPDLEGCIEEDKGHEVGSSSGSLRVIRSKTLHINSHILADQSPFFKKLFSNGMMESKQQDVTLQIHASEEDALLELLRLMHGYTLSVSVVANLVCVLVAADKFDVPACIMYCCKLLLDMPITTESALLYLEIPPSVLEGANAQQLRKGAQQYLARRYKNITKSREELMAFPLIGVEAILAGGNLQVSSEDALYDFVLEWARTNYPILEERREVLSARLAPFICFPCMSRRKLQKVLTCNDFDHEVAIELVLEALFFQAEVPHRQSFVERTYTYPPVKVVEFQLPRSQCVVYLDLKREDCANLFPSGRLFSQAFILDGQPFFLSARCNMDQQSSLHCFGLFLGMHEKALVTLAADYEFAVRSRPTEVFVSKHKGNYLFTGGKAIGYRDFFAMSWVDFIAEDSLYFVNGILHLRAQLTIRP